MTDGPSAPDPTPRHVTGPTGEPPAATMAIRGSTFTDRLAIHLADVRNADKAHRIVRNEVEQRLEALTRMVAEMFGEVEALKHPEDHEPCEVCGEPECPA